MKYILLTVILMSCGQSQGIKSALGACKDSNLLGSWKYEYTASPAYNIITEYRDSCSGIISILFIEQTFRNCIVEFNYTETGDQLFITLKNDNCVSLTSPMQYSIGTDEDGKYLNLDGQIQRAL